MCILHNAILAVIFGFGSVNRKPVNQIFFQLSVIISKCSVKMSGKVREFDHDWRVATVYSVYLPNLQRLGQN